MRLLTEQQIEAEKVNLKPIATHDYWNNRSVHYPCIICGKPVKSYSYSAHGVDGSIETIIPHDIILPDSMEAGDMGFYPIGSECVKKVRKFLCENGKNPKDYLYTELKNKFS